jgi:hypothetical protein
VSLWAWGETSIKRSIVVVMYKYIWCWDRNNTILCIYLKTNKVKKILINF